MLGTNLTKVLELLQAAELQQVTAGIPNIKSSISHNPGKVSDIYDLADEFCGPKTQSIKLGTQKSSTTGQKFAIKFVDLSAEANVLESLAIMPLMNHPNIIKLQETFEDASFLYIVMELCGGGNLFCSIYDAEGGTRGEMSKLMTQMSSALSYLHSVNICHRDLQPDSFLLKDQISKTNPLAEATVKMIEFQRAKEFGPKNTLSIGDVEVCTLQCVSPELLNKSGTGFTEKVDVWSLGVVFYMMMSGSAPFLGDSERTILNKISKGSYSFSPENVWKPGAKTFIEQMMQKDVATRLTAQQVQDHPYLAGPPEDAQTNPLQGEQLEYFSGYKPKFVTVDATFVAELEVNSGKRAKKRRSITEMVEEKKEDIEHPLKALLTAAKVNIKTLRVLIDDIEDKSAWMDRPLDESEDKRLPSPLIFAVGNSLVEVVQLLLEFGANPSQAHAGKTSYKGWVKPGVKPCDACIGRSARFIGTKVGEKLLKIAEHLQQAELKMACENASADLGEKMVHTLGDPSLKYTVEGIVGKSSTSVTKGGELKETSEKFAIKQECKKREGEIWEELTILGTLAHENVIKLRETFEDKSNIFVVLELCSGGSVTEMLEQMPKMASCRLDVSVVALQMAAAMEYIHAQKICHRDVQPDHFLLKDKSPLGGAVVKLIDFTSAKDTKQEMTTKITTLTYMAPEMLTSKTGYTDKVDVFSLGVLFYFLCCGVVPFNGDDEMEMRDLHQEKLAFEPPPMWESLPKATDLISKMLTLDPSERLTAADVVKHGYFER
jgi:serine/threonine protein kinase